MSSFGVGTFKTFEGGIYELIFIVEISGIFICFISNYFIGKGIEPFVLSGI